MKTWRAWLGKEEERLADLRGQGKTVAECAAALGRSCSSVKTHLQATDAPLHRPRRSAWLHVLTLGLTEREMAERMGVTRWAVKRAKQRIRRAAGRS